MQSLEAACEEAEQILEKVKTCSLPLSRPQDFLNILGTPDQNHCSSKGTFSIFDKLEELYREECAKELENTNKNIKSNSFLLEKLVTRESLNTLILNLHPETNEYSISIRMGGIEDDTGTTNNDKSLNDDNMGKMVWEIDDDFLKCIDNEELPSFLIDLFEHEYPELFYSGCIIVEVRDFLQPNSFIYDTHYVLLKPTMQTLFTDLNTIIETTNHEWSEEEKLYLESELTNSINASLCLDPSPSLCIASNKINHQRQLFNTPGIRKCATRFSLIGQKRKLDAISTTPGMELHDFITKKRFRSTTTKNAANTTLSKLKTPRMVLPAPSLENKKPLSLPKSVNTSKFRSYIAPRETKNCMPHLVEEYILDTDRQCERNPEKSYKLHIKLSILQRPFNSEYLGELYLDVDYKKEKNNGASSRFTLGSRSYVDKFIRQFTDMLTKQGRKSMNIMKRVPGQEPMKIRIPCMERDKAVEAAQQAQVYAAQQAAQLQAAQQQMISGPSGMANGGVPPNVVLVQGNQNHVQSTSSSVPILQAQLQSTSQPKIEAPRHHTTSTNPEISALVASFISTAQQIEQEAAAKSAAAAAAAAAASASTSANQQANAAILSLLNTSPVNSVNSATSAAVANAITNNQTVVGLSAPIQPQQLNHSKLLGRKMALPRVLNHAGNINTVNNNNNSNNNAVNSVVSVPQQAVRISALASQLASPPVNVIIAAAPNSNQSQGQTFTLTSQQQPQGQTFTLTSQQTQGQTFTLTTVGGAGFPTHVSYTTVPLNTSKPVQTTTRLMTTNVVRGLPTKTNGDGGGQVSGLSALLVNTPAADHPIPGANSASALLERLTASSSGTSPVPMDTSPTPPQYATKVQLAAASKNNPVITPLSSPPGQQTLNVHTLNLTPFQGALNNIPGIQNVQVQIPRLSSPLNIAASSNVSHPTSLIFSVAVTTTTTSTCTSSTQNSNATSSLGTNASVVIANNNSGGTVTPGHTSPHLPLPIAQLVATGVKGLTAHHQVVSTPNHCNTVNQALAQATAVVGGKSVQLVSALPRNTAQHLAGVKQQLTARGLLPAQRLANTTIKMAATTSNNANELIYLLTIKED